MRGRRAAGHFGASAVVLIVRGGAGASAPACLDAFERVLGCHSILFLTSAVAAQFQAQSTRIPREVFLDMFGRSLDPSWTNFRPILDPF